MVIRLFCAAGMSTSLLVKKMEEAAKEKGKDADIAAYPFTDMERMIEGVDVALLGPQVMFFMVTWLRGVTAPRPFYTRR